MHLRRCRSFGIFGVALLSQCIVYLQRCGAVFLETTTHIAANKTFCLSESIQASTYTHITISGTTLLAKQSLFIVIKEEGAEKPIYSHENITNTVSVSFTTIHGTGVALCITAPDTDVDVSLSIKSGADARDYSVLAKLSHMEPVDGYIQKALDEFTAFHKAQLAGSRAIDRASKEASKTFHLLAKFAVANSIFVIIATLAYVFYFRSFFMSKKVI